MAETFEFEGLKNNNLRLWLFKDVKNCGQLLQKVQSQSVEPECSFINASLVADLWLVRAAAFKALLDERHGRIKTHSLHGELVFNLSGSRHIGQSFKQYGVSEGVTNVLVGRFNASNDQEEAICRMVDGKLQPLSTLGACADMSLVQKALQLGPAEKGLGDLEGSIITRMAVRDC